MNPAAEVLAVISVKFPHRLSRLPRDADEKVIQEVGAASEPQYSVGQLEGEISWLA